jgi:hypothetical protein
MCAVRMCLRRVHLHAKSFGRGAKIGQGQEGGGGSKLAGGDRYWVLYICACSGRAFCAGGAFAAGGVTGTAGDVAEASEHADDQVKKAVFDALRDPRLP